jgi:hypothetical protein
MSVRCSYTPSFLRLHAAAAAALVLMAPLYHPAAAFFHNAAVEWGGSTAQPTVELHFYPLFLIQNSVFSLMKESNAPAQQRQ